MGRNAESGTIGELMRGADEPFRLRPKVLRRGTNHSDHPHPERPVADSFVAQEHHLAAFSCAGTRFVASDVATHNRLVSKGEQGTTAD
jgi:hypothetical protein